MKISVITATWNCVSTIDCCLDSVCSQDYNDVEHIIVDGLSTDGTVEVLARRSKDYNMLISEKDSGIYDALNKGIALSSGDIVGFLHADDFYASSDILRRVSEAFLDESVCAVYGDLNYVSKNDISRIVRIWRSSDFKARDMYFGWMPPHPTLFVRRSIYENYGMFSDKYSISADYDFVLRLFSKKNLSFKYLPLTMINMRVGGVSNRSFMNILKKSREDFSVLKMNGVGGIFSVFCKNARKISQFI